MRAEQIRKFDMLRRVQQFLGTWAARLGGVAATAAKKELDAVTREMGGNESLQATATIAARGETAKLRVLRRDLVNHHMRPVATIAAAHLRDVPDFTALQLPDRKAKLAVLMQDAAAMADKAAQHQQVFVDNGRSADFIARLSAAAAAVRVSLDARAASITQQASACAGLKANASRAHLLMRLLDAQVTSVLVDDPKLLAAWNSAKRIGKGKVVPIEATTPDQPSG